MVNESCSRHRGLTVIVMDIDYEIILTVILPLLLSQEFEVISNWFKYVHKLLVNHLED